jgi:hypothetical protein
MTGSTTEITEAGQRIPLDDLRAVALREGQQFTPDTGTLLPSWLQSRLLLVGASAIASISVYAMEASATAAADSSGCTVVTTVERTTTACPPGQAAPAPTPEAPDTSTTPDSTPAPAEPEPIAATPSKPPKSKKTGPKLRKQVSYDMCAWGSDRLCQNGCGDVVWADAATDFTGQVETPIEAMSILSPDYYVPGSGTRTSAWALLARMYHLNEGTIDLKGGGVNPLTAASNTIAKKGGVAVVEFSADLADKRSGNSPIAVVKHFGLLDQFKNGGFELADPHQGSGRYTEKNPDGSTHWWTPKVLWAAGLIGVWTLSRPQ